MNERGYTPTDEELVPAPLPPPEGYVAEVPTPEKPKSFDQLLDAAMEHATGPTRTIFGLMRSLNRSKWIHALIFGATISAGAHEMNKKLEERRAIEGQERVVAAERADYERLERSLGDKISYLDDQLGQYNPFFLDSVRSRVEVDEANLRELQETFSWLGDVRHVEPITGYMEEMPGVTTPEQREGAMAVRATSLAVRDPIFQDRDLHIPVDSLQTMLRRDFPRGWVEGEVASITQSDSVVTMPSHYGIHGVEAGHCTTDTTGRSEIVLTGAAQKESAMWVTMQLLPHEIAHANDWSSDKQMTLEQRVDLLEAVIQRLGSKDRYRSGYVESIRNNDQALELYMKATEYWAEISGKYFNAPTQLNKRDFDIVDRVVRAQDPTFNVRESINRRSNMVWNLTESSLPNAPHH